MIGAQRELFVDAFGHRDAQPRRVGQQVYTVFRDEAGIGFVYRGLAGPFDRTRFLGVLVPQLEGDYAICGYLGSETDRTSVYETLWALGQLRRQREGEQS